MRIPLLRLTLICIFLIAGLTNTKSQEKVIDQVVAKVGNKIILQSDIENQVLQYMAQGMGAKSNLRCEVLQELMIQKLLITQAEIDSLEVGFNQVESELNRRLNYFVRQIGSQQKLEEFYKKSILEIKEDFRPLIEEQIKAQMMQGNIVSGIDVSPKDVEKFHNRLPEDSIPMVNAKYKIQQISVYPPENAETRNEAREKLLNIRKRIIDGERFSTLAVLYSQDPGSARRGGELGFRTRDELDPAFAKAAFSLSDDGGVSRIVESEFGFHIIQLIAREGEQANVRHILIIPKVKIEQKVSAKNKLDSIKTLIESDSLSFELATQKYSEDEESRFNKGLMLNPMNTSNQFELEELIREEYVIVKDLKVKELSKPFESKDSKGKTVFKIVKINEVLEAHRANLKEDYELLKNMAVGTNQQEAFEKWLKDKKAKTYIYVDRSFYDCKFLEDGWLK